MNHRPEWVRAPQIFESQGDPVDPTTWVFVVSTFLSSEENDLVNAETNAAVYAAV